MQFSHFSVKEYLTSARLSISSEEVSRYHIALLPAHTILAQACVSVLLQLHDIDEEDEVGKNAPLARYAAEYWARHAQFEDVVSRIKGMEYLFDLDKPYFTAWRQLYDIDTRPSSFSPLYHFATSQDSSAETPLYYAALCGFRNLVEQLIVKHPQHVNSLGGYYRTPAVAALAGRHFQLAQVLYRNGSSVDLRGSSGWSPLESAANSGDLEILQLLLDCGVDVNALSGIGTTPLHPAAWGNDPRATRMLLDRGADPNIRSSSGLTPLHNASRHGKIEMVRLLVEHGASVEAEDNQGKTPLDFASGEQRDEMRKLLLERIAK